MILQFHNVSLDPEKRELRCSGEEVAVQPLALDLLLYLIRNRDRVVPKQELLEKLWPDAIVAEGSLTRAISLARTALKPGGAEAAIRTHARQGYRFVAPLAGEPVSAGAPGLHSRLALPASALESAHAACDRGAWDEAIALFKKADAESPLAASDLECWAVAARCAGKGSETSPPLERAVAARAMGGDPVGSARAATLMAIVHLERRELAVAQGWLARARRKLEGSAERPEHGHVAWVASKFASELGDHDEAYRLAEDSYQIGRRLGDVDLEALGLLQKGSALLAMGRSDEGAPMHDEAAAVVLSDAVTPLVGGTVYCGVLFGCRNGSDWQRASQWSTHFKAWCDRNGLGNFLGPCRLHRAEVLTVRGQFTQAEAEAEDAARYLADSAPWAVGEAMRVMGDSRLFRGDLAGAEAAYRRSHELGWDPQPGFSLLMLEQGRLADALRALDRALNDPLWAHRQRRGILLAHLALVAAMAGALDRAAGALRELDEHPELWRPAALRAEVARARAEVFARDGRPSAAVAALQEAVARWAEVESPSRLADARLRLAELLADQGDGAGADLEAAAAEATFQSLGYATRLDRCRRIRNSFKTASR